MDSILNKTAAKAAQLAATAGAAPETLLASATAYAAAVGGEVALVDGHVLVTSSVESLDAWYDSIFSMSMSLSRDADTAKRDMQELDEFLATESPEREAGFQRVLWIDGKTKKSHGDAFEAAVDDLELDGNEWNEYCLPADCFPAADSWNWEDFKTRITYGVPGDTRTANSADELWAELEEEAGLREPSDESHYC
jgi:hypothetical protein